MGEETVIVYGSTSLSQLEDDLLYVSTNYFQGNVSWPNTPVHLRPSRRAGQTYRVTPLVNDLLGPGHSRTVTGRRSVSVCWHFYGFFARLGRMQAIRVRGHTFPLAGRTFTDEELDWQIAPGLMASQACDCRITPEHIDRHWASYRIRQRGGEVTDTPPRSASTWLPVEVPSVDVQSPMAPTPTSM